MMKAFIQLYKCAFIDPSFISPNSHGLSPSRTKCLSTASVLLIPITKSMNKFMLMYQVSQREALAHRSVLHARLRTGGTGWWRRLNRWCQGAEESCYEGQSQPSPGTEHGAAVTMAYIIREAEQITWVARQFEVDAGHTGAQRDDAEGTCGGT